MTRTDTDCPRKPCSEQPTNGREAFERGYISAINPMPYATYMDSDLRQTWLVEWDDASRQRESRAIRNATINANIAARS